MALQGGNDPRTRSRMQHLAGQAQQLMTAPRQDLDTLTMEDLLMLRDTVVSALPLLNQMCDTRIKQSLSRAKVRNRD